MPNDSVQSTTPSLKPYIEASRSDIVKVAALGVVSGILVPLLGMLLAKYFLTPVFCRDGASGGICGSEGQVAYHAAMVIVALAATTLLANWNIYRPLLVVLGVTVALWGLQTYIDPLVNGSWIEHYAFSALIFGAAYTLFYWLMRLRNFPLGVLALIGAVLLVRWALVV